MRYKLLHIKNSFGGKSIYNNQNNTGTEVLHTRLLKIVLFYSGQFCTDKISNTDKRIKYQ